MNRRTSIYTIRFDSVQPYEKLQEIARPLGEVSDIGDSSISFRSVSDRAAEMVVEGLPALDDRVELTTGLGVHRRIVALIG